MSDIAVVLCRPSEPGNAGAVCRAMKNMGLSRLRLVAPGPMDEETVLARAIHAGDVWRDAASFGSLAEAVEDCALVVGTTARRGKRRKTSMRPREIAARIAKIPSPAQVALVFGNERTGLDAQELDLCDIASHIPVSDGFPSLNLSHAVQVYAYELFLALGGTETAGVKGEWVPMDRARVDSVVAGITDGLESIGFYRQPGRDAQERFLRDMICRAGLSESEGRYLGGIFDKAAGIRERRQREGG